MKLPINILRKIFKNIEPKLYNKCSKINDDIKLLIFKQIDIDVIDMLSFVKSMLDQYAKSKT